MTPEQFAELAFRHGGIVGSILVNTMTKQNIGGTIIERPNPNPPRQYTFSDGTTITVSRETDPTTGLYGDFNVVDPGTALRPGEDQTDKYIQGPDGNWYMRGPDGGFVQVPGIPREESEKAPKYHEYGGNVYVEDPSAPNGLRMVIPAKQAARDPLADQLKQLQIQQAQQDLQGPLAQNMADEEAAINAIQQRLASGQMTTQEAEQMMQAIRARGQAGLQGTTPYQMQTDRQGLARNVLNDRMGNASSLASSLMSGLGGIYSGILAGTGAPLMDPFAMARGYTDEMGGGQQMSEYARSILMGALQGQGGQGAPLPTGAGYMPPPRQMPRAGQPATGATGVEQWRPIVARYFPPEAVDNILRIMEMESSGLPTAHNPGTQEVPEDSYGLMQINRQAHPQWAGMNLADPDTNIRLAAELFRAAGYSPWYNAATRLGLLGGAQ